MKLNKLLKILNVQENVLIKLCNEEPCTLEEFKYYYQDQKCKVKEIGVYKLGTHDHWSYKHKPGTTILCIYCKF